MLEVMPSKRSNASSPTSSHDDDEYRKKRERNNLAVKKCRIKSTEKAKDTKDRIDKLKNENSELEARIDNLQQTVKELKDLILHVRSNPTEQKKAKLEKILAE